MLQILADRRRSCRICIDRDPGQIQNGSEFDFDPPILSYWSQWLGHNAPKILVVGQDFGDVGYFNRFRGQDERDNTTNNNLRKLLEQAGLKAGAPPDPDHATPVFLTNSILCLKTGPMSASVKEPWVRACSREHLSPLISHLKPSIIIGMGSSGWLAVRTALQLKETPVKIGIAAGLNWTLKSGVQVFPVGHCSGLGIRNRPWAQQVADWRAIGLAFQGLGRVS